MKERQEGGRFLSMSHCLCHPYLVSEVIVHLLLTPLSRKAGPLCSSSLFHICCMTCFQLGTTLFIEATSASSFDLHGGRPFTLNGDVETKLNRKPNGSRGKTPALCGHQMRKIEKQRGDKTGL